MNIQVALDGPSGSGKSTMAKRVSDELGLCYIDTGALYRTVGLFIRRNEADAENEEQVMALLPDAKVSFNFIDGAQHVYLGDEDVTGYIRTPEMSEYASKCSTLPCVREYLLDLQRNFAHGNNVIMDGRDIGTVILPDAPVKIYLTAAAEARAYRRWLQLKESGVEEDQQKILQDVIERDERDMNREIAPLRCADDAVVVDSTDLELDETYEVIKKLILDKAEELGIEL